MRLSFVCNSVSLDQNRLVFSRALLTADVNSLYLLQLYNYNKLNYDNKKRFVIECTELHGKRSRLNFI